AKGRMALPKRYTAINPTKSLDQKTGKPIDYNPTLDIQVYSTAANQNPSEPTKKVCPSIAGGNNYFPSSYSPRTKLIYIPALTACVDVTIDTTKHSKDRGWNGGSYTWQDRFESDLTAVDPITGEVKKKVHLKYPNCSATLDTAGALIFLALLGGTVA